MRGSQKRRCRAARSEDGDLAANAGRPEYIFDPETSSVLGRRAVLVDPGKAYANEGLSAGTVIRDVAYLQSKVVDSTRDRPMKAKTGSRRDDQPVYRR